MLHPFNAVRNDPARSHEMGVQQNRVIKFICSVMPRQAVARNRKDPKIPGSTVSDASVASGARIAHVCPFVLNSIDRDLFWIGESGFTDPADIRQLLEDQIPDFINAAPQFDPLQRQEPAPGYPYILKTFMTVFPNVAGAGSTPHPFEAIHQILKPQFVHHGLALGQFYPGCPQEAVYAPTWNRILEMPYPAFAIRYLVPHDHLFIPDTPANRTVYADFLRYFPGNP